MPPRPPERRRSEQKILKFDRHPRTVQKVQQAERGVHEALVPIAQALREEVLERLVDHQVLTAAAQRALLQALLALEPLSPADRTALIAVVAKRSKAP